jgi:aspartate/methionine/tyrosine aminotransferase
MRTMNEEAKELNGMIKENNAAIYHLLSKKGREIYFPKKGVVRQGAEAKGKKINATIGMAIEDDGTPMRLPSMADWISLDPKDVFPYVSSFGKQELREAWQELIIKKNPSLKGKISLPIVTSGLSHALSTVGYLFINPGDKIFVTDKYWGNYRLIFEHGHEGILHPFNTFKEGGLDLESFKQVLEENKGKQIILFSLPNNPTGYTPTEHETVRIAEIIKGSAESGNQIIVIDDDAYFGLVYKPGIFKESLFSKLADIHERVLAIKIDGATKECYSWGLRVGFITYAARGISEKTSLALENKTAGAVRGSISNASHLSQSLVLKAITSPRYEEEKKEKYDILKRRFDKVQEIFIRNEQKYSRYFSPLPFNSGYFMCIELKEGLDAETVRQTLLKKYSTGVIAVGNLLRIAFSSVAEKDIPTLIENIYDACQ